MSVMGYFFSSLVGFLFLLQQNSEVLCEGFWPENDLNIPASEVSIMALNQQQFNNVLDRVESFYQNEISNLGGRLEVKRLWDNGTVNASAMRVGRRYIINMYGGMARFHGISEEAFALVACHEIGHHIAGAPKINRWMSTWASNEGQSDYYAGLKCFRHIYQPHENLDWLAEAEVPEIVWNKCSYVWTQDEDRAACARFALAGENIAQLFRELKFPNTNLNFESPDPSIVIETDDGHPKPQCRLDTYFSAALCDKDVEAPLSDDNPEIGTCVRSQGYQTGVRPLCWYKPSI